MSDTSQGPGWWIASDGKWYSPEQKPGPAPEPPAAPAPTPAAEPVVPEPVTPEPVTSEPEAPTVAAPVTPPPVAPETPPPAAEPPTEPIPVTAPPTSAPPPTYVPPPVAAPPGTPPPGAPPGGPPPMMTPPAGGYGAPPVAGAVSAAPDTKGKGCLKAVLIVGAIIAVLGIATVAVLVFAVNKGVDTLKEKEQAQQKVENRTGIHSNSFNTEHPPQDDLGDWTCSSTPNGFPQVTGSVKNNSSHTSSYAITVDFKASGSQFDSASGLVVSVDPGQSADFAATGSVKPTGQFSCKIDTIDRTDIGIDSGN